MIIRGTRRPYQLRQTCFLQYTRGRRWAVVTPSRLYHPSFTFHELSRILLNLIRTSNGMKVVTKRTILLILCSSADYFVHFSIEIGKILQGTYPTSQHFTSSVPPPVFSFGVHRLRSHKFSSC